jgi:hypothetical protein
VKDKTHHIRKRFPDNNHTIDHLLSENPEFPTLCEDYGACVDALQYWTRSKEPEAETRVTEYQIIIQELEDEIHQAFTAAKPQHPD